MNIPHVDIRKWPGSLMERLRSRVMLPFIGRTVSLWGLLLLFLVLTLGSAGGVAVTNRSIFCSSCHEMRVHYQTWQVSSHKDVECEQCHVVPGLENMVKAKMAAMRQVYLHVKGGVDTQKIKGHVPDVNCKKCHTSTREVVVYHGTKITHQKHWNMGVGCTFCHSRVVHGPNAATKNTPAMATCFKCHDGKKVPNTCGTCHETLGNGKPQVFTNEWVAGHKQEIADAKDLNSCKRCHQPDFCDNCHKMARPHPANWLDVHADASNKKQQDCTMCHNERFCSDCHQNKQAHKPGWMETHAQESRRDPKSCQQCHDKSFCSDCHTRYRPHPVDWGSTHPAAANANPASCKTCHQEKFCVDCHQGKTPPSHQDPAWERTHGTQISQTNLNCTECHNSNFCMKCHKTHKPESHDVDWRKLHPIEARRSSKSCNICHNEGSCDRCHGTPMPHPGQFRSKHPALAKSNRQLCARCHDQQFCQDCHRGSRPSTHKQGWVNNHGSMARNSATCANCHTKDFCNECHSSTMPLSHKGDWLKKHGATSRKSPDTCSKCHAQKSCSSCHGGLQMPHPANWTMEHKNAKGASLKEGSLCYKCHEASYCKMCHSE